MSGGRGRTLLAAAVTAVVVAAVAAAFLYTGSPQDARARRLDEARVTDLAALRTAIDQYRERTGALPDSLEQVARSSPLPVRMTDPVGGRLYEYERIDARTFRLCAIFDFPTSEDDARARLEPWAHGAGRQCFRFRQRKDGRPMPGVEYDPLLEGAADSPR